MTNSACLNKHGWGLRDSRDMDDEDYVTVVTVGESFRGDAIAEDYVTVVTAPKDSIIAKLVGRRAGVSSVAFGFVSAHRACVPVSLRLQLTI